MCSEPVNIVYIDALEDAVAFYGKYFPKTSAMRPRLFIHPDYTLIDSVDTANFMHFAKQGRSCAVTACVPELHPYLLYKIMPEGHDQPLCDVPREARAERRRFPPVLVVRPALVWLPAGEDFPEQNASLRIFPLPYARLLDKTKFLEALASDNTITRAGAPPVKLLSNRRA